MDKIREKEKLREIQVLRAIAFIFVLIQHSLGGTPGDLSLGNGTIILSGFIFTFAEVAVPIFLFISGLTLTYSYKDKLNIKNYYKNRILYLIIPYFIWSFINIKLHNPDKINNYFEETIAGNGMFHLWYMGMIIRMVLVFPIIIYIGRFIKKQNIIIKISSFIGLFIGYHYVARYQSLIQNTVAELIFKTPTDIQIRIISLSFLFWSIFVIIGVFAGFNYSLFKEKVIKYRYIVYLCFITFFFYKFLIRYGGVEYNRTFDILYRSSNILFFYLLSIKVIEKIKLSRILYFIGKYSYAAYMIHIYVLYKFIFFFRGIGITEPITNSIISTVIASISAPGLIYLISFIPKSRVVTGVKDNYKNFKEIINKNMNYKFEKNIDI